MDSPPVPDFQEPAAAATPPAGGTPQVGYAPYVPPPAPRRRSRAWIVLAVIAIALLGICGVFFWLVASFSPSMSSFGGVMTGKGIALIHLNGVIAGTTSGGDVTPEIMLRALDRADRDPRVRAILLRIDSPGGTVAASEEIASAVKRARKPVVASIGDTGASGAYMVASQCDEIVAVEGSTVGSIGVILQVLNIQQLAEKLGVAAVTIKAGEYKDAGSPFRSLTATETALFQQQVDEVYEQFIDIVAEGRDMPRQKVEELATGFTWSGTEAKKLGLVDTVGTYSDAIDRAAALGKIEGEPQIIEFDAAPVLNVLDLLGAMGSTSAAGKVADEVTRDLELQPVPK